MTNHSVRPLTQEDEAFLWEMLYLALYVPEGHLPLPKEIVYRPEISKYVDQWGKVGDKGYVAINTLTQETIGAIWIRLFAEENQGYGYIDKYTPELSIAVLPEYRNRGSGKSLLKCLLANIQGDYPAVSLSVSVENPAVRLYRQLGFEIIVQNGESITMKKTFSQAP
jgi:GNAT superfamily N-acetyltransferase